MVEVVVYLIGFPVAWVMGAIPRCVDCDSIKSVGYYSQVGSTVKHSRTPHGVSTGTIPPTFMDYLCHPCALKKFGWAMVA